MEPAEEFWRVSRRRQRADLGLDHKDFVRAFSRLQAAIALLLAAAGGAKTCGKVERASSALSPRLTRLSVRTARRVYEAASQVAWRQLQAPTPWRGGMAKHRFFDLLFYVVDATGVAWVLREAPAHAAQAALAEQYAASLRELLAVAMSDELWRRVELEAGSSNRGVKVHVEGAAQGAGEEKLALEATAGDSLLVSGHRVSPLPSPLTRPDSAFAFSPTNADVSASARRPVDPLGTLAVACDPGAALTLPTPRAQPRRGASRKHRALERGAEAASQPLLAQARRGAHFYFLRRVASLVVCARAPRSCPAPPHTQPRRVVLAAAPQSPTRELVMLFGERSESLKQLPLAGSAFGTRD
jgi:hypothetical protein